MPYIEFLDVSENQCSRLHIPEQGSFQGIRVRYSRDEMALFLLRQTFLLGYYKLFDPSMKNRSFSAYKTWVEAECLRRLGSAVYGSEEHICLTQAVNIFDPNRVHLIYIQKVLARLSCEPLNIPGAVPGYIAEPFLLWICNEARNKDSRTPVYAEKAAFLIPCVGYARQFYFTVSAFGIFNTTIDVPVTEELNKGESSILSQSYNASVPIFEYLGNFRIDYEVMYLCHVLSLFGIDRETPRFLEALYDKMADTGYPFAYPHVASLDAMPRYTMLDTGRNDLLRLLIIKKLRGELTIDNSACLVSLLVHLGEPVSTAGAKVAGLLRLGTTDLGSAVMKNLLLAEESLGFSGLDVIDFQRSEPGASDIDVTKDVMSILEASTGLRFRFYAAMADEPTDQNPPPDEGEDSEDASDEDEESKSEGETTDDNATGNEPAAKPTVDDPDNLDAGGEPPKEGAEPPVEGEGTPDAAAAAPTKTDDATEKHAHTITSIAEILGFELELAGNPTLNSVMFKSMLAAKIDRYLNHADCPSSANEQRLLRHLRLYWLHILSLDTVLAILQKILAGKNDILSR